MEDSAKERLARISLEANYYRSLAEELQRRIAAMQALAEEHRAAASALAALPKKEGDAFLPVGGGAYLKGKVSDSQKVLVEVGARVLLETPREEALKIVGRRESDLRNEMERAGEQLQVTVHRLEELGAEAQAAREGAPAEKGAKPGKAGGRG